MKRYALLSVYDKSGISEFAKSLVDKGYTILSTGGTMRTLDDNGIPHESISDYTSQNEILGGRVKTLHPKIHAGILSRRDNPDDQNQMTESGFANIDIVVVNLYPFVKVRQEHEQTYSTDEMIEYIDIGGPTLLRAAAKNFKSVFSVIDPEDYSKVIEVLDKPFSDTLDLRKDLAAKVFANVSSYDLAIAEYISKDDHKSDTEIGSSKYTGVVLSLDEKLRYGENPHQLAATYNKLVNVSNSPVFQKLQGKELSYNNINDTKAALSITLDMLSKETGKFNTVFIKHANPCGIAYGKTLEESFRNALSCDPVSAFGGIISFSHNLDSATANLIVEAFYEVVIAPKISPEALEILSAKKNLRVLECDHMLASEFILNNNSYLSFFDKVLVQSPDAISMSLDESTWVSGSGFEKNQKEDAELAWLAVKHISSNAISIVSEGKLIGVGAGQMNRVDSSRIAVERASRNGFSTKGSVVASDAFFPFPDSIEIFKEAGVDLLVQPGGSMRDKEVIKAAQDNNIKMIFTGKRHFKH